MLPAGDQKVTVTIGEGEVTETIPLAAGQTVEKDIIVGVGHVVANAYYTAGGDKVDAGGLTFQVVKAKKKIDGSREDIGTTYGPDSKYDLPPGDYVLIAEHGPGDGRGAVQPSRPARPRNSTSPLNAGVLAITAPGASTIEVFARQEGHPGQPQAVRLRLRPRSTRPRCRPATTRSSWRSRTRRHQGRHRATVKAGERTEVTVPM